MNTLSQVIGLISKESINWTEMLSNVDAQDQENQVNNDQINSQPSPQQQNQFSFELNSEMRQNSHNLQNSENLNISQPVQRTWAFRAPVFTETGSKRREKKRCVHLSLWKFGNRRNLEKWWFLA